MEKIPDAFTDAAAVTKSPIEAANVPARITISDTRATDLTPEAKQGRPPRSKDSQPRQKKPISTQLSLQTPNSIPIDNEEISIIHYMHTSLATCGSEI